MVRKPTLAFAFISLLTCVACVTVNIYFPAAKVERAAEDIVEDVYGTETPATKGEDGQSALENFMLACLTPTAAHAAQVSNDDIRGLKQSNSAIRGLKASIADDHKQLIPYYNSGNIGINNEGLIEIISKEGLSIKETAQLRRLVAQDNDNREQLYAEVAASMDIPGTEIAKVKSIFAEKWQESAPSGWFIQGESGKWRKK